MRDTHTPHVIQTGKQDVVLKEPERRLTIGFLCESLVEEWTAGMWEGVHDMAFEQGVNLFCFTGNTLCDPRGFSAQANVIYELIDQGMFDGLVLWGAQLAHHLTIDDLVAFCKRYHPVPIVNIGLVVEGVPSLLMDNYQGMHAVVTHLITGHGCRRIAYLSGPGDTPETRDRYRGYVEALAEHGLTLDHNLIITGHEPEMEELYQKNIDSGEIGVRILLDHRQLQPGRDFEALVGRDDGTSRYALSTLQRRGFRVPADVAVASFDDMQFSQYLLPPLTTAQQSFYDLGRQGTELLIARLRGQDVPDRVILPMNVIVRQSCGCQDRAVAGAGWQAHPAARRVSGTPLPNVLHAARDTILPQMIPGGETSAENARRAAQILESFSTALTADADEKSADRFLRTLDAVLLDVLATDGGSGTNSGEHLAAWQTAISGLRQFLRPYLDEDTLLRAETLWQQARVLIGETARRAQGYQGLQAELRDRMLQDLGATLITTFDVQALLGVLADGVARLGIPSVYLAQYEHPQPYQYPQPAPEWAELLLAYHAGNPSSSTWLADGASHRRFRARQLAPDDVWQSERRHSFVVMPLYFRDTQLGFFVCEVGPREGKVYDILRGQMSSALQGALLVQQVQDDAHELAAAYEEIKILNNQLQQDNVRMSAELDVVKRLQQMILPRPEELQQIPGLDIVGYMQPADEVGGDYYDVLHGDDGLLHIGIGDVTGHGLESGVVMLMTQAAIRTLIEHGETDPVKFVNTLNRLIYKNVERMGADKNLTFALVQYQGGQFKLVGQHEEVLVVRQGGQVERVNTMDLGFPVGLEPEISQWVKSATITLQPGDGIVLYTDGIPEAENLDKKQYGLDRLCAVLSRHWHASAEAIKHAVVADVMAHIGTQKVYDDITLVVLKQQ